MLVYDAKFSIDLSLAYLKTVLDAFEIDEIRKFLASILLLKAFSPENPIWQNHLGSNLPLSPFIAPATDITGAGEKT